MKKALALLLVLVMVLGMFPMTTFAAATEPNVSVTLTATQVEVGETFDVKLGIKNMSASSVAFGFDFDTNLVEVTGITSQAGAKLTYSYVDDFEGTMNVDLVATSASTKAEANADGHIGFVWANANEVPYTAKTQVVMIRFTAKANGTVTFAMFEDSAGTDGYKGQWTATETVTIGSSTPTEPECEHTTTKLVPNSDGKTHNVVCSDCDEPVTENVTCTATDDKDCTTADKCACGNVVTAANATHTGGNATCTEKAECSVCGKEYGNVLGHKDENTDHACDYGCGTEMGEHKSNAAYTCQDGICEYCKEPIKAVDNHKSEDKDHNCDVCGAENIEGHTEATKKVPVSDADCNTPATFRDDVYCTKCGETISTGATYTEGAALGHTWGAPTYNWNTDYSACTATRVCEKNEEHEEITYAKVTSKVTTTADCVTNEVVTYTATFEEDWAETQTNPVTGEKDMTNHAGTKTTSYTDNGDGTHTKTVTCSCGGTVSTDTANHDYTTGASVYTCVCGAKFTGWDGKTYIKEAVMLTGWQEIDGAWYYLNTETGVRAEDLSRVPYPTTAINGIEYKADAEALAYCEKKGTTFIDATEAWFMFENDGKFAYNDNGYISRGDNQGRLVYGMLAWHPGLIEVADGVYAYFIGDVENGGNIGANGDTYITKNNGNEQFAEGDIYNFVNGELSGANGVKDGKYYQNSRLMLGYGLTEVDGKFIYVRTNGHLATGKYYISNTANYEGDELGYGDGVTFDANGYAIEGIVDGKYYVNGMVAYGAGVVKTDAGYIYVRSNGVVVKDTTYWITNVGNSGLVAKAYTFDADGIIQNPEFVTDAKNGIVDGYYYENGNIVYGAGLIEYNDGYIYVRSNGQVATGKYWVTNTNDLMEAGYYTFGEDGMMIK